MRIIAFAGRKGGVGKTTAAVNVAGYLAAWGHKTLLADLDPQGNASLSLGYQGEGRGIFRLLVSGDTLSTLITVLRPNLDLLPGGEPTATARDMLAVEATRQPRRAMGALSKALQPAGGLGYAFVLLDLPPALDLLAVNASMAADEIALPVACDALGLVGARQFIALVDELAEAGSKARIAYVIPTFYRGRGVSHSTKILDELRAEYGVLVTEPIPLTSKLAEAAGLGRLILEHDPRGRGALAFEAVTRMILECGHHEQK